MFYSINTLQIQTFVIHSEVNKEIQRIENELKIFSAQLSEAEKQLMEHEDKNNELLSIVNKEKNSCFEREKELNDKTKEFEMHKEREVVLLSDKYCLFKAYFNCKCK